MATVSRRITFSSLRNCSSSSIRSLSALPPSRLPPDRMPCAFSLASFCRSSASALASAADPPPPNRIVSNSLQRNLHLDSGNLSTSECRAFKSQLLARGSDCISLKNFVEVCKQQDLASSTSEATKLAIELDQSGLLLLFHNHVFLRPEKIRQEFLKALPFALSPLENDPRQEEFCRLQKEMEEIHRIARSQVRKLIWTAFTGFTVQSLVFFRLTFWDLSWDVMEPVTFFTTSSSLLAGSFFFLFTSRDPSYKDIMHTLLNSRIQKLMKKRNFDTKRFRELQMHCYPYSPHIKIEDHL